MTVHTEAASIRGMSRFALGWPIYVVLTCAVLLGASLLFAAPVLSSAVVVILTVALPLIVLYLAWQVVTAVIREVRARSSI